MQSRSIAIFVCELTALLVLARATAIAQAVANAEIRGLVTDATGAVVPGAQIKATQVETAFVRTTTSGSDGSFVLPNLPVGPYKLEVSAPAFNTYVRSGIL